MTLPPVAPQSPPIFRYRRFLQRERLDLRLNSPFRQASVPLLPQVSRGLRMRGVLSADRGWSNFMHVPGLETVTGAIGAVLKFLGGDAGCFTGDDLDDL